MENRDHPLERPLVIDKDASINVMVTNTDEEDVIDLGNIFRNMKNLRRVYAWVLILCLLVGICAPLLMYQFTASPLTVSSIVTLKYDVPVFVENPTTGEMEATDEFVPVTDLTAPDGTPLDLSQVTSAYVLQNAMSGLELSQPVTLANIRDNLAIERILTEDTRRKQEVAANMIADKNSSAYREVQDIQITYNNQFKVSLTNGFGEEDSRNLLMLRDDELTLELDRVLMAYNDYLIKTYVDQNMPDDEFSVIHSEDQDILETLDMLRSAISNLDEYMESKSDTIRAYRSAKTGYNLEDLTEMLQMVKENNVDYLYSYVYANSIAIDRNSIITNYQYQLRTAQTKLEALNEKIANVEETLKNYRNDEVFVSMQESDTTRATKVTTDYYNNTIAEQSKNYADAADLELQIAELQNKLDGFQTTTSAKELHSIDTELNRAIDASNALYKLICEHMEEIVQSDFYTTYAEHTSAYGKQPSFLQANMKRIAIFAVLGAVVGIGLWFLAAFMQEMQDSRKKSEMKQNPGKEAAGV